MPQDPLHLLCIEPRFPGRLGWVADWLVRHRGYRATFFCHSAEPQARWPESTGRGLEVIAYNVGGIAKEGSVPWTRVFERGLCHAFGCWEVLDARRIRPVDAILGRTDGLGSSLFASVSYPHVPVMQWFDYYFPAHLHDLADEATDATPIAFHHWRRATNAIDLIDLENGVYPWTPTAWQKSLYPREYQDDFLVLHDGVDTRLFRPRSGSTSPPVEIAGRPVPNAAKVVSFIARSPDRLRGFDRFIDLVSALQRDDPGLIAIVVGDSEVHHSVDFTFHGRDYASALLAERPSIDPDRLWRLGSASRSQVAQVLARTDLHVVPGRTYPVARSTIEAMASGAPILAVDNEPIREVLENDRTALLSNPENLLETARRALKDADGLEPLGKAAAEVARARFSRDVTLPRLAEHLQRLVERGVG